MRINSNVSISAGDAIVFGNHSGRPDTSSFFERSSERPSTDEFFGRRRR